MMNFKHQALNKNYNKQKEKERWNWLQKTSRFIYESDGCK